MARYNPALQAVPALGQVGVLALGGWLAIEGTITLGTFLAFSSYLAQLVGPVRVLTALVTIGQQARASVIRVLRGHRLPPGHQRPARRGRRCRAGAAGHRVRRRRVRLRAVRAGAARAVAAASQPGETLALVGTSGSGKSTISLLLPRFYDVSGGAVRVGGHDVRDLTQRLAAGRDRAGHGGQLPVLRHGAANIAYGRPDATDEQVIAAARAAEARRVHPRTAGRLRHRDRRAGPDPVRRPAAAGGAGPRADHRPAAPAAGRRHLGDRRRGIEAEIHATLHRVMARPDHAADRAPAVHPAAWPTGSRCWTSGRLVDVRHARGADRALRRCTGCCWPGRATTRKAIDAGGAGLLPVASCRVLAS